MVIRKADQNGRGYYESLRGLVKEISEWSFQIKIRTVRIAHQIKRGQSPWLTEHRLVKARSTVVVHIECTF